MKIFLARNNEQAGPYSLEEVNAMLDNGQVVLTDLMWHPGMDAWKSIGDVTNGQVRYQPNTAPMAVPATTHAVVTNPAAIRLQKSPASVAASALELAPISKRVLGKAIDWVLVFISIAPLMSYLDPDKVRAISATQDPVQMQQFIQHSIPPTVDTTVALLLLALLITQTLLIWRRGQSLGKLLVGTRIVDQDSQTLVPFWRSVLLRTYLFELLYLLSLAITPMGVMAVMADFIPMLTNQRRQAIHDQLARTLVVMARPAQLPSSQRSL